jgi:hypothetical protein
MLYCFVVAFAFFSFYLIHKLYFIFLKSDMINSNKFVYPLLIVQCYEYSKIS